MHKTPRMWLKETKEGLTYAFYDNDELGVSEAIMYSIGYSSDNLAESNYDYMVKQLTTLIGKEDEQVSRGEFEPVSNWHIEKFNPSVFHIVVRVYDADHNLTSAFNLMNDFHAALDNYPILDEDDYSERGYNDMIEYLKFEISFIEGKSTLGFINPDNHSYEDIARNVYKGLDSTSVDEIQPGQLETELFDLGYTDYPVYIVGIGSPGCIYDSVSYFEDENSAREYMESTVLDLRGDSDYVNRLLDLHVINPYLYVEFSQSTLSNLNAKSFNELND